MSEELKACTLGMGCDEAGVCYAAAHGEPERCPHYTRTPTVATDERPPTFQQDPRIHALDGECVCGAKSCPLCFPTNIFNLLEPLGKALIEAGGPDIRGGFARATGGVDIAYIVAAIAAIPMEV